MRLKMAENSLFAVLLRSQWWISVAIAAGVVVVSRTLLPADYWLYGAFGGLPFLGIAVIAASRQLKQPGAKRTDAVVERVRAMSLAEFSAALEAALRRDGCEVRPVKRAGADLELSKAGRVTLLACRRWKAAQVGVDPLRELHTAIQAHDAHDGMFVTVGEVSDSARAFAARNAIRLIDGGALALLLRD